MAFRPKLGVVKKNAPSVSDPAMKRVVDTIYKDINSLSDSLHLPSGTHTFLPRDGNPGDIRLYEGTGNDFIIIYNARSGIMPCYFNSKYFH